jgi:hypothetical protein
MVSVYIDEPLEYLRVSQESNSWIASLRAHVFAEEHE